MKTSEGQKILFGLEKINYFVFLSKKAVVIRKYIEAIYYK